MHILRSTPIYLIPNIEDYLPYWRDRLHYEITAQVPHGASLGFVILSRDKQEVMLQTLASASDDLPEVGRRAASRGIAFFHEVDDLDEVMKELQGLEIVGGPRTAPYGMREVFIVDSAGFVHGYAQKTR